MQNLIIRLADLLLRPVGLTVLPTDMVRSMLRTSRLIRNVTLAQTHHTLIYEQVPDAPLGSLYVTSRWYADRRVYDIVFTTPD